MVIHLNIIEAKRVAERYFAERNEESVTCVIESAETQQPQACGTVHDVDSLLLVINAMKNAGIFGDHKVKLIMILRTLTGAGLANTKHAVENPYHQAIEWYRTKSDKFEGIPPFYD